MIPLFVSFFTPDYAPEAAGLVESLHRFGLPCFVQEVPSSGCWTANCARKPSFLLEARKQFPGQPVVWLDADARVRQNPTLFESIPGYVDLAVHYRDGTELLSGTMYWGAGEHATRLLKAWRRDCELNPSLFDQRVLQGLVDGTSRYRVTYLPATYTAIFDARMCGPDEIVIEHMQASRRLKEP